LKVLLVVLSAGILVVSGLYIDVLNQLQEQVIELEKQGEEIEALTARYERLAGLPELMNLSIKKPVTHLYGSGLYIVSGYGLEYWHRWEDSHLDRSFDDFYVVFYAPRDNLTLQMYLFAYPMGVVQIPLTLQRGNAFQNESGVPIVKTYHIKYVNESGAPVEEWYNETIWQSPVIWSVNASENRAYETILPTRGWYTMSMTGPIQKTSSGATRYRCMLGGLWVNGTWQRVDYVQAWVDFKLLKDEKPILFVVKPNH